MAKIGIGQRPTIQRFTSGTALTYTTPANVKHIIVTIVGGGGGGGGAGVGTAGVDGTDTTFGTNLTAGKGIKGNTNGGGPGDGGTNVVTAITGQQVIQNVKGGKGVFGGRAANTGEATSEGAMGLNPMGGSSDVANCGAGGKGGANNYLVSTTAAYAGDGGGAGGYLRVILSGSALAATFTYTVGAAGTGGAGAGAGQGNGQIGSAGLIVVEEFYQ